MKGFQLIKLISSGNSKKKELRKILKKEVQNKIVSSIELDIGWG
jgi:hypothetical protein